jgi:hypothetical protein
MALRTPPSWLQQGSHPAENDRLTMQGIVSSTGILGTTSLAVSQSSTPAMSVQVAAGWGAIVSSVAAAGVYQFYNDAATTLTVTAANPTNPRIDRIVATVNDAYYSGLLNNVTFTVVAGTPAGSPSAPATPSNSISLATIAVAAGATSIVNANITDTRSLVTTNLIDTTAFVTLSGSQTLSNKTLNSPAVNYATLTSPEEITTIAAIAATGTINFDVNTQADLYYTTNASANFTLNFRASSGATLNSILPVGASVSVVFRNTNGATPYYPTVYQIDGSAVTPKWQGGTAPTAGNASSIDVYSFVITKTAATPTYLVLASQTRFA